MALWKVTPGGVDVHGGYGVGSSDWNSPVRHGDTLSGVIYTHHKR